MEGVVFLDTSIRLEYEPDATSEVQLLKRN